MSSLDWERGPLPGSEPDQAGERAGSGRAEHELRRVLAQRPPRRTGAFRRGCHGRSTLLLRLLAPGLRHSLGVGVQLHVDGPGGLVLAARAGARTSARPPRPDSAQTRHAGLKLPAAASRYHGHGMPPGVWWNQARGSLRALRRSRAPARAGGGSGLQRRPARDIQIIRDGRSIKSIGNGERKRVAP